MASLTNQKISNSYLGLLNTTSNGVLTSSLAQITDGNGNGSPIYLSTAALNLYNKYTFPDAVPANGTFLKATDSSGTLEWVAESGGDVKKTGAITINTIAVWNDATETLRSDPAMSIVSNSISLLQKNGSGTDTTSYNIGGGNIVNVTGQNNVGFGSSNMQSVTTGNNNTAFGSSAIGALTIGSGNTSIGKSSLFDCNEGDNNTGIGLNSLTSVTTGDDNTAVGMDAGQTVTTGSSNTFIGKDAGRGTTGSSNTFLGNDAGTSVLSGSKNVIIGSNNGGTIATSSNNIIISDGDGNARIQVNSVGSVGIGGSPTSKLNVVDSASGAAIKVSGAVTDTSVAYYGFMHDGTDLQGTTQVNMFYSGGAIKASTTIAEFASFRIDAPSLSASGSAITNSYGIYQASTAQKNYFAGSIGIGVTSPIVPFHISGTAVNNPSNGSGGYEVMQVFDNTSAAQNVGGGIGLGGNFTGTTPTIFGEIRGLKENSTDSNYASALTFSTRENSANITERMRISSGGNVGIGIAPTAFRTNDRQLQIKDATSLFQLDGISSSYLAWNAYFDGSWKRHKSGYVNMLRLNNDNNGISFYQSGNGSADSAISFTEPLTISSGGNVGIGTSSPDDVNGTSLSSHTNLQVFSTSNAAHLIVNGGVNGSLLLNDSGASANSRLWRVMSDGGVFSINALTDATAAKHNTLEISEGGTVAIYGAASSSHQFLIHGFDNGTNFNTFSQNLSDQELFGVRNNGEFQTGQATNSPANNSTTGSGNCFINSAGTLVTTGSSKKFKNTITDATHGLSDVLKLRSVTYKSNNTKIDGDKTFGGFIAEEVNDIGLTEFVHYDDDDEPKSLHYANMVSLLTKAIQEQQTIIEDLKARIEKLEL